MTLCASCLCSQAMSSAPLSPQCIATAVFVRRRGAAVFAAASVVGVAARRCSALRPRVGFVRGRTAGIVWKGAQGAHLRTGVVLTIVRTRRILQVTHGWSSTSSGRYENRADVPDTATWSEGALIEA